MSAHGNGGRYEYYACTARQKYGPKACRTQRPAQGDRLPRAKLEQAVLAQLADTYRDGNLIQAALAKAKHEAERRQPKTEQRRASVRAEINRSEQALGRYHEAFEQGKLSPERCEQRTTRLQARLDDLRAQDAELALEHPTTPHSRRPRPNSPPSPTNSTTSSPKPNPSRPRPSSDS
jgi:hypothetical protein